MLIKFEDSEMDNNYPLVDFKNLDSDFYQNKSNFTINNEPFGILSEFGMHKEYSDESSEH